MAETHHSRTSGHPDEVLIISDNTEVQSHLTRALQSEAHIRTAQLQGLSSSLHQILTPVAVLTDSTPDTLALVKEIVTFAPRTKVLVVAERAGSQDHELSALDAGASDYLEAPVHEELLRTLVRRALHTARLEAEIDRLKTFERQQNTLLGGSPAMLQMLRFAERVSGTDVNTLICGESGTGKGVMARAIHDRSLRSNMPFVAINCASLPEEKLDIELFGIEKRHLGERRVKIGKIEAAHGGTLFLDEIGDMPLSVQAKMLRFFQDRAINRIGGDRAIPVDVKVVSATYHDLKLRVAEKKFRDDLLHVVGEVVINIPPLRERGDDVLLLSKAFLLQYSQNLHRQINGFTDDAVHALMTYIWPGNVRELQNKVKSAVILADGTQISAADLALTREFQKDNGLPLNLRQVREEAERNAVTRALARAEGNMSQTANLLGISRPTLYTLIDKYSLQR